MIAGDHDGADAGGVAAGNGGAHGLARGIQHADQAAEDEIGFDAREGQWVNMITHGIVDPTKVTRSALMNAASIAALFLTTEAAVASKPEPKTPAPALPEGGMY